MSVVIFLAGAASASVLIAVVYMFHKHYKVQPVEHQIDPPKRGIDLNLQRQIAELPAHTDSVMTIITPVEDGWDGVTERRHRNREDRETPPDHHRRRMVRTEIESSWPPRQEQRRW